MAVVQLETGDHQPENGFVTSETASPGLLTHIDSSVLPFLGGFGKYQKQLIVLTWIPALFIGFSQNSDDFLLAQPNNTCANLTNYSMAQSWSLEASVRENTSSHNDSMQCHCNEWTFEMHTGLVQNVVTQWSLVCDSAWKVHIAKFSLLVGSIFGYLVFGILADWFGRHPGLIISVLFVLVFGLTVAFSVNVTMFSTMRFFEGFCLAGITLSLYVMRIELCLPRWRFSMTMVAIFVVLGGQFLMPGVAHLCRNWQVLQAVIICPLLLMLSYIWIFPESLRWLLATQHYSRSKWIMGHIAEKNGANIELDADNILTELQMALQKKPKKTCIVKMVGTRNLWKNIVVLCVNSLTGCGIHHCFVRSMMGPDAQYTTIFHGFYTKYYTKACIAVASCIALCPIVALMGRRGGLLMLMIITALASLLQLGLLNLLWKYSNTLQIDSNHSGTLNRNFSIAFSIIGMFSSDAVKILSIFFCAEITPTVIRGGGLGLVLASAGFGSLTAPIMELHNQKGYFLHHIIFACCTLICIICILLLPEARGQPLPETLADGESYTRQPILPPRKSGEQCSLLPHSASTRDYTKEQDTLQPLGPSGAVSTMDSAVSSAVDLTAPMAGDMPAHIHPSGPIEPKDPNGHAVSSPSPASETAPDIAPTKKEHLLSSSPLHKAPCLTDPLLWSAEDLSANPDLTKPPPDCIPLEINDIAPSPTSEENSGPAASLESSPPVTSQTPSPSMLICTTPIIEPLPSSPLESPNLQDHDVNATVTPSQIQPSISPPQLKKADEAAVTPPIRDSQPPDLDLASACVEDSSVHSSPPASSSIDSPRLTPPPPVDSAHVPSADSSTTTASPHVLPVTDIVQTSTPHSTFPNVTDIIADSTVSVVLDSRTSFSADSDSTEPAPSSLIDCTVSSPIDSGFLPISEGETVSTGNNTVNCT